MTQWLTIAATLLGVFRLFPPAWCHGKKPFDMSVGGVTASEREANCSVLLSGRAAALFNGQEIKIRWSQPCQEETLLGDAEGMRWQQTEAVALSCCCIQIYWLSCWQAKTESSNAFSVLFRIVFLFGFSPCDVSFFWWSALKFILLSLTNEHMSWCCDHITSAKLGTGSLKYNLPIIELPIT